MKKNITFLLVTLLSISLTSCTVVQNVNSEEKEVTVYDIDKIADEEDLSKAYQTTLKTRFVEGEEYIPYLTINQYASLFEPHLIEGARNEFKNDSSSLSWYIYVGEDLYFYTYISLTQKYILKAGDIEGAFAKDDNPRDLTALNYAMTSTSHFFVLGSKNYSRFSFANAGFTCFKDNNEIYLPLGFYDISYSESAGMYFTYNYNNIYSTRDVENYANKSFKTASNNLLTVDQEMEQSVSNKDMPNYLINYNADLFVFLMDNFYGLKDLHKISSMKNYYSSRGIYQKLYSKNAAERSLAYVNALHGFDDNHTVLVSVNKTWGETANGPYGKGVVARSSLRSELRRRRAEYYTSVLGRNEKDGGEIIYSQDKKTAMFHFESFAFGTSEQVFNENESIKDDAYLYDTYINFIRIFNEIKTVGSVKNVVIDVSTNGGGVVGVMMKLLALISKDNKATISMCDATYMGVSEITSQVDVNFDGVYNPDEVFGNDFNIFVLTSNCSFSAGNAFPCYAKNLGAKIIGERSGGGECAVAIHYLPNSQYVYHSSNLHLGFIDFEDEYKEDYVGFESGAPVDIDFTNKTPLCYFDATDKLTYNIPNDFYDINAIQSKIANYKS